MGMTNNQQMLIMAVAKNDMKLAKQYAICCLHEDKTLKNERFCEQYGKILESTKNVIELPASMNGIVYLKDMSNSFKENRYYLSERENDVYKKIIRMRKVGSSLAQMDIRYANTTLLYGASGTGKTTFGEYVAYKTGLPYCYLNFSNLIESYMGNTSKNISKAFSYAIDNPCVFMLDEIDCISIKRSSDSSGDGTSGEMARITVTLMQEFDKLPNDVIVIGATNRIDRVDDALLRRFAVKHEVKPLTDDEKVDLVRNYLNDIEFSVPENRLNELITENHDTAQSFLITALIQEISKIIYDQTDSCESAGLTLT